MTKNKKEYIRRILEYHLEDQSFEEFLENFDLSPIDVFIAAFEAGLVDEDELSCFVPVESEWQKRV